MSKDCVPYISIVIPAYNEGNRICAMLDVVVAYVRSAPFSVEVIIVDDGSSDDTARVSASYSASIPHLNVLSYLHNQGKGYAVQFGVCNASGTFILMADADGATAVTELSRLLPFAEKGADIVIGSRALKSDTVQLNTLPHRKIMGRVFNFFVSLILGLSYKDTQCGFKLFRKSTCVALFEKQSLYGFGFDVEILFLAQQHQLKVVEVPVSWSEVRGSKVHLVRDSMKMFIDLLAIRGKQMFGKYALHED